MSDIHKKLVKIQSELNCPKNQRNNFGNYNYRSCEDIVEAVKPLLHAEGLVLLMYDDIVNVGNHNYIKATATISDGKDNIHCSAMAREAESRKGMDDSQLTGATSSYARKYALNGLFAIDDTKDADSMKPKDKEEQVNDSKTAKTENKEVTVDSIKAQLKKCNTYPEVEALMKANVKFVKSLFKKEQNELISAFTARKNEINLGTNNSMGMRND